MRSLKLAILAVLLFAASHAKAATYYVGAEFADTTIVVGSFTTDGANAVLAVDLWTYDSGAFVGHHYFNAANVSAFNPSNVLQINEGDYEFRLSFASPLPVLGTINLAAGSYENYDPAKGFRLMSGIVTTDELPEPATWGMLSIGLTLLGLGRKISQRRAARNAPTAQ